MLPHTYIVAETAQVPLNMRKLKPGEGNRLIWTQQKQMHVRRLQLHTEN